MKRGATAASLTEFVCEKRITLPNAVDPPLIPKRKAGELIEIRANRPRHFYVYETPTAFLQRLLFMIDGAFSMRTPFLVQQACVTASGYAQSVEVKVSTRTSVQALVLVHVEGTPIQCECFAWGQSFAAKAMVQSIISTYVLRS